MKKKNLRAQIVELKQQIAHHVNLRWMNEKACLKAEEELREQHKTLSRERDLYKTALQNGGQAIKDERTRIREVGLLLIEEIGASGPEDTETTAARAVQVIRGLRAEVDAMRPVAEAAEAKQPDTDNGLPIRPGDVWQHDCYGERTMVEFDDNAWMTDNTDYGRVAYMNDSARKRGDWTFVRRGGQDAGWNKKEEERDEN